MNQITTLVDIEFRAQNSDKVLGSVTKQSKGLANQLTGLVSGFSGFALQLAGIGVSGAAAYKALIDSNSQFRDNLLATQAILISTNSVFDAFGNEITDASQQFRLLEPAVKDALEETSKLTDALTGVTNAEVQRAFSVVLQNVKSLSNQSKEFNSVLEAAPQLTANLTSALAAVNLPAGQLNQELTAILSGNITEDAQLAKKLGITREDIDRAREAGELVDFLNDKLSKGFAEANLIAKQGIGGSLEDIQETFAKAFRLGGVELTDSIENSLRAIADLILENKDGFILFAEEVGTVLAQLGDNIFSLITAVADGIGKDVAAGGDLLKDITRGTIEGLALVTKGLEGTVNLINKVPGGLSTILTFINPLLGGIIKINTALNELGIERPLATFQNGVAQAVSIVEKGAAKAFSATREDGQATFGADKFERDIQRQLESSDAVTASAAANAKVIQRLTAEKAELDRQGVEATEQQAFAFRNAASLQQNTVEALNKELKELQTTARSGFVLGDAELTADVKKRIEELEIAKLQLEKALTVDVKGKPFEIIEDAAETAASKFESAAKSINTAIESGDTTALNQSLKSLKENSEIAFQFNGDGIMAAEAALEELGDNIERLEPTQRIELFETLGGLIEKDTELKTQELEVDKLINSSLVARGTISSANGKLQDIEIQKGEIQLELEAKRLQLANAIKLGIEGQAAILQSEIKVLETQQTGLEDQKLQVQFDDAVKQGEIALSKANASLKQATVERQGIISAANKGEIDTAQELQQDLLKAERDASKAQLGVLEQRLGDLRELRSRVLTQDDQLELDGKIQDQLIAITEERGRQVQFEGQLAVAALDVLEARQQEAEDLATTARLSEQLVARRMKGEQDLGETVLANQRFAQREALAFARERLEQLQNVEVPQSREARLELEKRIREAKVQTLEAAKALLDEEAAAEERLRGLRRDGVAEDQAQANKFANDALDSQVKLARARNDIQDALSRAVEAQINRRGGELQEAIAARKVLDDPEATDKQKKAAEKRLKDLGLEGKSVKDIVKLQLNAAKELAMLELARLKRREKFDIQSLEIEKAKAKLQNLQQNNEIDRDIADLQDEENVLTAERDQAAADGDTDLVSRLNEEISLNQDRQANREREREQGNNLLEETNSLISQQIEAVKINADTDIAGVLGDLDDSVRKTISDAGEDAKGLKQDNFTLSDPERERRNEANVSRARREFSLGSSEGSQERNSNRRLGVETTLKGGEIGRITSVDTIGSPIMLDNGTIQAIGQVISNEISKNKQQVDPQLPQVNTTNNTTTVNQRSVADPSAIGAVFGR